QPELAQPRDDLVREALLAIELLGHGRDLLLGEVADRAADQVVLGRQVEVHGNDSDAATLASSTFVYLAALPAAAVPGYGRRNPERSVGVRSSHRGGLPQRGRFRAHPARSRPGEDQVGLHG